MDEAISLSDFKSPTIMTHPPCGRSLSRQQPRLAAPVCGGNRAVRQVRGLLRRGFPSESPRGQLAAYRTTHKPVSDDFIPAVLQHVLELNRMLRTNSPAGGASRTSRHVVKQRLYSAGFFCIECPCRAVLDAGQTPVAVFIHLEVSHVLVLQMPGDRIFWEIASAACFVVRPR